jgi:stage II sporulation protein D
MSSSISSKRRTMTRRQFAGGFAALLACARGAPSLASPRPISFGVFSLFEPREMTLSADLPLLLRVDDRRFALSSEGGPVSLRVKGDHIQIRLSSEILLASRLRATSFEGGPTAVFLAVPPTTEHGGVERQFEAVIDIDLTGGRLRPVVSMDIETAVASIVAAESSVLAPEASFMAQAVASRSFLLAARTVHTGFDFCDTTHCQFLRGPAPVGSSATTTSARTEGLCLYYEGRPLAAMYSRSCSGRTCSLEELGLSVRDYPYYPVDCEFCLHHPEAWVRELDDKAQPPHGERERIAYARIHGWSALPSSSFVQRQKQLQGRGIGHGLGLCQRGAMAMARAGIGFDRIVAHYYPNTNIATLQT